MPSYLESRTSARLRESIAQGLHGGGDEARDHISERAPCRRGQGLSVIRCPELRVSCATSPKTNIDRTFAALKERYGKLHVVVHERVTRARRRTGGEF